MADFRSCVSKAGYLITWSDFQMYWLAIALEVFGKNNINVYFVLIESIQRWTFKHINLFFLVFCHCHLQTYCKFITLIRYKYPTICILWERKLNAGYRDHSLKIKRLWFFEQVVSASWADGRAKRSFWYGLLLPFIYNACKHFAMYTFSGRQDEFCLNSCIPDVCQLRKLFRDVNSSCQYCEWMGRNSSLNVSRKDNCQSWVSLFSFFVQIRRGSRELNEYL